jgi:hypothetical protein
VDEQLKSSTILASEEKAMPQLAPRKETQVVVIQKSNYPLRKTACEMSVSSDNSETKYIGTSQINQSMRGRISARRQETFPLSEIHASLFWASGISLYILIQTE